MGRMCWKARAASIFFAMILCGSTVRAQNAPAPASTLPDDMKSAYKLTKLGTDSSGTRVVEGGTVLTVQKGGMLGVPAVSLVVPTATYKDGDLHAPGGFSKAAAGNNTKLIDIGEKVYVLKVGVDLKNDKVTVTVIECDECNGAQQPSSYKSSVAFQFPKGYLAMADAGQVKDIISQVLALEAPADDQQQAQDQGQPQDEGNAGDQQAAPPPVQVGQTYAQVLRLMGMPKKIMNVGTGQVYVYNDFQVTFVNGRVVDVQQ